MKKYIFLDTWVFDLLRQPRIEAALVRLIKSEGFTVLITRLSMVELYNPGWQDAGDSERGAVAARFLARVPCIIADPGQVWEMEVAAHLTLLPELPQALDLADLAEDLREVALLGFLRRHDLYLQQGRDIHAWSLDYDTTKKGWLQDVEKIIEGACRQGYLKREKSGRFTELQSTNKEVFLFSLDGRHANPNDIDAILASALRRKQAGYETRLTAVRLSSLCFWYSYVDIDRSAQPKHQGSDIGDHMQISLLPYCSAFTTDRTMAKMLRRIRERVVPVNCELMTKSDLEERVRRYM
jgi:hypothetical protein